MPNGRPGDHPYTDIVVHGNTVYSAEVTELVEAMDEEAPDSARQEVRTLLWIAGRDPPSVEVWYLKEALVRIRRHVDDGDEYEHESPLEACLADDGAVYTRSVRESARETDAVVNEKAEERGWVGPTLGTYLWVVGWETDDPARLRRQLEELQCDPLRSSLEYVLWE